MRYFNVVATVVALSAATPVAATTITDLSINPLTGSAIATPEDGVRQVDGTGQVFLDEFEVGDGGDVFRFQLAPFGVSGGLNFINAEASQLPISGVNMIVLQDAFNPANPDAAFNAGSAANLIAKEIEEDSAGFFIYFNSVLGINRLVFSENLSANTADLAILAAIQGPQDNVNLGPAGVGLNAVVAELQRFENTNFAAFADPVGVAPVPLPAAGWMLLAGMASLGLVRRRR